MHGKHVEYATEIDNKLRCTSDNVYFSIGVSSLTINNNLNVRYIEFRKQNIINLVGRAFLLKIKDEQAIIISDDHLMPLAAFYHNFLHNVIGVVSSRTSIFKVQEITSNLLSEKNCHGGTFPNCDSPITLKEYILLNDLFSQKTISEIASIRKISTKTLYSRLSKINKKMKVRKLEDLLT